MMRFRSTLILSCVVLFLFSCKQKEAATTDTKASSKVNSSSKEHFDKGNDYLFNDDLENAKKEYLAAVQADTTNWKACYELASVFSLLGEFGNAYTFYNRTVELNPKFATGFYSKANLEEMVGDDKQSEKDMRHVLELKKDMYMAILTLGRKEYAKKNYKMAIRFFDTAISMRNDFYMVYNMRGSCKYSIGDVAGAIADFDQEIKLFPTHSRGYVNRAVAYGEQKNYRAAINDLNEAINIEPLWSQGYIYRGLYYIKNNTKDSACGDFRIAYKLKNPDAEAYSKQYCQ
jgi:tetratricopeptide (TPR) repeat protein